jgi:hypothetical protein
MSESWGQWLDRHSVKTIKSDREASLEAYAEYFHGVSEEVGLAMQMLRDLSAYTSPEHMRELRDTFAGALAAVDKEAI